MSKEQMSIEREINAMETLIEDVKSNMRAGVYPDSFILDGANAALNALRKVQEWEKNQIRQNIFEMITAERARQDHKWGAPQENTFSEWAGILAEECGEASAELNELNFGRGNKGKAVKELIEAAAVAVAVIEQYDVAEMVTAAWYAYRSKRAGGADG